MPDAPKSAFKRADELRALVAGYARAYYVDDAPVVSDEEYDALFRELTQLEERYPELAAPDSPTRKVGGEVRKVFPIVAHRVPMLSLNNAYSEGEMREFHERIARILADTRAGAPWTYHVEAKIDGLAVSVAYEGGAFSRGVTRGDGVTGEDVSHNIRTIRSLPMRLAEPVDIEVRGEVFYPTVAFDELNHKLAELGEKTFANPRNAAAGTIRQQDSAIAASRPLDLVFYQLVEPERYGVATQHDAMRYLARLGLKANPVRAVCRDIAEIARVLAGWRENRGSLPFPVDGAVVKVNELALWPTLGMTAKAPRAAIAYKWAAESVTTRLLAVEYGLSRNGILTPVAILEPVLLSGSTVGRATLHNQDEIARLGIMIGDTVRLEKGGDVIPKVTGVTMDMRAADASALPVPESCPECGEPTAIDETAHNYACRNKDCRGVLAAQIAFLAGRSALDIEGLGEKASRRLVDEGFVAGIPDLFRLVERRAELVQLDRFADISVDNLLREIDAAKTKPLVRWIIALGIPQIGASAADELAERFGSFDALAVATEADILRIYGFGEVMANSVVEYFADERYVAMLAGLAALGVSPGFTPKPQKSEVAPFAGKTIVLTGAFPGATRDELKLFLEHNGAKVAETVSKKTNMLVSGDSAGSKLEKARKLGVRVVTPDEFTELVISAEAPARIPPELANHLYFSRFEKELT